MNFKKTAIFLLAMLAMVVLSMAATDTVKAECPKKVDVVLETVKAAVFMEYQFSGQGQAESVAIKSPVSGLLSEIKVSEGSLVDAGQDLVVMNAGMSEEIKKLEEAAAKAKKILTARQNWKEKSEKAIQNAAQDYKNAQDLVNEKKAQANQIVKAPLAGIVHLIMAVGSETSANDVLLEISNPRQMQFQISLTASDRGSLAVGDKFVGTTDGISGAVEAEVIEVSNAQAIFRVNNTENQVKEGVFFIFKKVEAQHAGAIVIPATAVQHDSLGDFVYVAEKKKAKKLYVTLGKRSAGKAMVLEGLIVDTPLIISALECLADGKSIRIVNQEELSKGKVEARAKEKEKKAAQTEKIAAESEVKAEKAEKAEKKAAKAKIKAEKAEQTEQINPPGKSLFMVGVTFERFYISDENFTGFYPNSFKHIPGLEVSYQAMDKMDIWASGKLYSDKQSFEETEDAFKFSLIPVSLGVRFRPIKLGSFEPFVGAGLNLYFYSEKINEEIDLENTSGMALGFHFQGGSYYCFSRSFLKGLFPKVDLSLLGEVFLKYNIVNKTLAEMTPDETDKLNLGGFEMGIGLAVKF